MYELVISLVFSMLQYSSFTVLFSSGVMNSINPILPISRNFSIVFIAFSSTKYFSDIG